MAVLFNTLPAVPSVVDPDVAISVGDGDVFVGDSRKQHGVSEIEGPGTRLSCVSYCDTRMANVK